MTKHTNNGFARSPLPSIYCVLAALLLVSVGSAYAFETKVEVPQKKPIDVCKDGYNSSSASNSCSSETFEIVLNNNCRIYATCNRDGGGTSRHWITITPGDAANLQNCNGRIKTSC